MLKIALMNIFIFRFTGQLVSKHTILRNSCRKLFFLIYAIDLIESSLFKKDATTKEVDIEKEVDLSQRP